MKKVFLLVLLGLYISTVFAQNQAKAVALDNNNEIRLNALYLILGAIEVDYEYVLNDESGLGVSVFLPIDEDIEIKYYVAPYYRFYFGKKPAAGFFAEGFMMLNNTEDDGDGLIVPNISEPQGPVTDLALGIGIGGKFLTNRGFLAEISLGVGRNLFTDDSPFEFIGKGGIKIGYRF
ncbi:MAG: DUF3575 domain-containing protein [Bacteroidota bacterium]